MTPTPEMHTRQADESGSQLARLHAEHADYLQRACRSLCASAGLLWTGEADDLAQATWYKVAKLLARESPPECVAGCRGWLRKIALNLLRDTLRRRARRKARERTRDTPLWSDDPPLAEPEESAGDGISHALEKHCSPIEQQVVKLKTEDVQWEEIAKRLHISRSKAIRTWNKAIQVLRSALRVRDGSIP